MEDPFEEDYPVIFEEKIVGKELLFQVRNDCSYQFNGGECFDVMRICEDLQLIDDFHNLQLIVTPKKVLKIYFICTAHILNFTLILTIFSMIN